MIFIVLLIFIALLLFLERYSAARGLEQLREEHSLSTSLTEPDEPLELILRFANRSRFFIPFLRYREKLPEAAAVPDEMEDVKKGDRDEIFVSGTTWLKPRQTVEKRFPITFTRRGRFVLDSLKVSCGDFLGLKDETRSSGTLQEIVVVPKPLEGADAARIFGGFLGDISVRRFLFEDPVLTLGFREYTGREPMKMISWTQSARRRELMVKNYDYTMEPSVLVLLNIEYKGEDAPERIERCCSAGRSVCESLEKQNVPYDFAMNALMRGSMQASCYIPEGLGERHLTGILECLGRASYETVCSCTALIRRTLEGRGAVRGVLFITPAKDAVLAAAKELLEGQFGCPVTVITAGEEV